MKTLRVMTPTIVLLFLCVLTNAQTVSVSEDSESLRKILANQPNYIATEKRFAGRIEGNGHARRLATLGNQLAEIRYDMIIIKERDKPTLRIFTKRKEYEELPFQNNYEFTGRPHEYASMGKVIFKSLGPEKVGNYTCIKFEASHQEEGLKQLKFLFWSAPELKGLVIKSEKSYGSYGSYREDARFWTLLEDVSLDVDEAIFRVPAGYKKLVEPEL